VAPPSAPPHEAAQDEREDARGDDGGGRSAAAEVRVVGGGGRRDGGWPRRPRLGLGRLGLGVFGLRQLRLGVVGLDRLGALDRPSPERLFLNRRMSIRVRFTRGRRLGIVRGRCRWCAAARVTGSSPAGASGPREKPAPDAWLAAAGVS